MESERRQGLGVLHAAATQQLAGSAERDPLEAKYAAAVNKMVRLVVRLLRKPPRERRHVVRRLWRLIYGDAPHVRGPTRRCLDMSNGRGTGTTYSHFHRLLVSGRAPGFFGISRVVPRGPARTWVGASCELLETFELCGWRDPANDGAMLRFLEALAASGRAHDNQTTADADARRQVLRRSRRRRRPPPRRGRRARARAP